MKVDMPLNKETKPTNLFGLVGFTSCQHFCAYLTPVIFCKQFCGGAYCIVVIVAGCGLW